MNKPKPRRPANIIEAVTSPDWWGPWFPQPETWTAWRSFWKATFALPMEAEELHIYQACTGRTELPDKPPKEISEIIGRRGGKTRGAATTAAWLAVFVDWRPFLAPGEKAMILLLAADRRQARIALRYVRSLICDHPELKRLVVSETQESIELRNRVIIEVTTASFRTIRGYSIAGLIADEIAYWFDGEASANPAEEILAAARPAMATMGPDALLLKMSSPHARRGPLWEDRRRFFGKDDAPVLVWQAPTKVMNPSVPQRVIDEAYEQDPARAAAEYGAEFRSDVETYVSREVVDAAVVPGRFELPYVSGPHRVAFCDPAGGSGGDSFTLAISSRRGDVAILEAVRERRPPFSPDAVISDFSALLKSYHITKVTGDRWGGEFPREAFRKHGISYEVSEKSKSEIYGELLPVLNSGRVELLDLPRANSQLCALEVRTARGGKTSIDHPPGGAHDDIINSIAGSVVHLAAARKPIIITDEIIAQSRIPSRHARMGPPRHARARL